MPWQSPALEAQYFDPISSIVAMSAWAMSSSGYSSPSSASTPAPSVPWRQAARHAFEHAESAISKAPAFLKFSCPMICPIAWHRSRIGAGVDSATVYACNVLVDIYESNCGIVSWRHADVVAGSSRHESSASGDGGAVK